MVNYFVTNEFIDMTGKQVMHFEPNGDEKTPGLALNNWSYENTEILASYSPV